MSLFSLPMHVVKSSNSNVFIEQITHFIVFSFLDTSLSESSICLLIAAFPNRGMAQSGSNFSTSSSNFFKFSLLLRKVGTSFPGHSFLAAAATLFLLLQHKNKVYLPSSGYYVGFLHLKNLYTEILMVSIYLQNFNTAIWQSIHSEMEHNFCCYIASINTTNLDKYICLSSKESVFISRNVYFFDFGVDALYKDDG